jgi:hypothetical protein
VKNFSQPPVAVVASFKNFADSVSPHIYRVLDSAGLHRGWNDERGTADDGSPELHVRQLTDGEAKARLYEADLSIKAHSHAAGAGGLAMPRNVFLQFSTIDDADVWALLTNEGYPFTLVTESHRNDLPLDIQVGIRDGFETRLEFAEWRTFRRAKLLQVGDSAGG